MFAGARSGQPGLIASFQENPTQLERIVQGFGWSLKDEGVHHMYRSTVDMYIDEWVYELLEEIERHQIKRVLIDSLGDLRVGVVGRGEIQGIHLLAVAADREVRREPVHDAGDRRALRRDQALGIRHLASLRQRRPVAVPSRRVADQRALTVLKTRASAHDPRILEFEISEKGIALGTKFEDDQSWD